jgi:hypothetical protein
MRASETELTGRCRRMSMLTTRPAVAIGACLDRDLFQGLIEVDKHLIPVVRHSRLGFHGLAPTPNAFPWLALGSRLTTTPGSKMTHGYSRRAPYVPSCAASRFVVDRWAVRVFLEGVGVEVDGMVTEQSRVDGASEYLHSSLTTNVALLGREGLESTVRALSGRDQRNRSRRLHLRFQQT